MGRATEIDELAGQAAGLIALTAVSSEKKSYVMGGVERGQDAQFRPVLSSLIAPSLRLLE
jgi:hypothetical protein